MDINCDSGGEMTYVDYACAEGCCEYWDCSIHGRVVIELPD